MIENKYFLILDLNLNLKLNLKLYLKLNLKLNLNLNPSKHTRENRLYHTFSLFFLLLWVCQCGPPFKEGGKIQGLGTT